MKGRAGLWAGRCSSKSSCSPRSFRVLSEGAASLLPLAPSTRLPEATAACKPRIRKLHFTSRRDPGITSAQMPHWFDWDLASPRCWRQRETGWAGEGSLPLPGMQPVGQCHTDGQTQLGRKQHDCWKPCRIHHPLQHEVQLPLRIIQLCLT